MSPKSPSNSTVMRIPTPAASPPLPPGSQQNQPSSGISTSADQGATTKAHSAGTCPGDGRCDGTGGTSACSGCPTFNNAVVAAGGSTSTAAPTPPQPAPADTNGKMRLNAKTPGAAGQVGALSCANCGTSTTPLWRRDDVGNNICNACGTFFGSHLVFLSIAIIHPYSFTLDSIHTSPFNLYCTWLPACRRVCRCAGSHGHVSLSRSRGIRGSAVRGNPGP